MIGESPTLRSCVRAISQNYINTGHLAHGNINHYSSAIPFRFLIPIPVLPKEVFVSNCNETFKQTVVKINKQRNTIKHAQKFFIERYVEDLTNWNLLTTLKSIKLPFYFGSSFVMKIMGMEIKNVGQATRVFDCLRHNGSHND